MRNGSTGSGSQKLEVLLRNSATELSCSHGFDGSEREEVNYPMYIRNDRWTPCHISYARMYFVSLDVCNTYICMYAWHTTAKKEEKHPV